MPVSSENIHQIAHLSRLQFDSSEIVQFTEQFNQVLQLVEKISQVDTSDVTPMANPLDNIQRLREDRVSEQNQRDKMQQNAPQTEAGLYLVPTIIE